jgi:two-component system sensor histidine kinase MprB
MTLQRRIAFVSAAAVAIAVLLASLLTYVLTSQQLRSQVDNQLRDRAGEAPRLQSFLDNREPASTHAPLGLVAVGPGNPDTGSKLGARNVVGSSGADGTAPTSPPEPGHTRRLAAARGSRSSNPFGRLLPGPEQVRGYQQVVNSAGKIQLRSNSHLSIPVDARTRELARDEGEPFLRSIALHGTHLRVLALSLGDGRAVQFAQPLTEVDSLLSRLRLILISIALGGIALAALLGRIVAGAAVIPVRRLRRATEHVALTQDLSGRIEPTGDDEIGRLASSFNAMLDALELSVSALDASVHAQRQLVADASHELRTPVTSLRTNIEILQQQGQRMDPEEHRRLLGDVVEQIEELTLLISDLIDLARGEEPRADVEELRLDVLVTEVLERARRHAPATPLHAELEPTLVVGVPARLERAIGNLIDNAVKYGPAESAVEVRLRAPELTVRDYGSGIAAQDLPHIFDRFYRGAESRGRPGSGLGLAIVRQVAGQLGGSVSAEPAPGRGTIMRLRLPGAEPVDLEALAADDIVRAHSNAGASS